MNPALMIRDESYGATLYDPRDLSYRFLTPAQTAAFAARPQEPADDCQLIRRNSPGPLPQDSLAAPVRVYFELTTRCNAGCQYCLNRSGAARANELTTAEAGQVIEALARDGVFEVRLTGGEPTQRPDFFELARTAQRAGLNLTMNSNLLVPEETLRKLIDLMPALLITSLDGDETAHQAARPAYTRVADAILCLRQAGVPVRINCALNRNTLPHVGNLIDRFAPYGCGFTFILLRPVGRATGSFQPPALADLMAAVEVIEERRKLWPDVYFSTSFHVVMEQEQIIGGINLTGCNAIQKSFNVNSDGSVLPCAFLYELDPQAYGLGNIRDWAYSVLPIWRESTALRQMRQGSADCNARCIHCAHFKTDCLGSCYMMANYAQRTGRPDPYCYLSTQRAASKAEG
jgi:MoaA/NifB/PqqE/SkfB family radical SAM enzyme